MAFSDADSVRAEDLPYSATKSTKERLDVVAGRKVIVDAGGDGDYTSIATAVSTEAEGAYIYIANGAYTEGAINLKNGQKLIGQSRTGVVITFTAGGINMTGAGTYTETGTIAVTGASKTITGTGTQFQTDGLAAGDYIIINGQPMLIASVVSETSITLEDFVGDIDATTAALNDRYYAGEFLSNVEVRNLTMTGVSARIDMTECVFCHVSDVTITDTDIGTAYAFGLQNCFSNIVRNTSITNLDDGFMFGDGLELGESLNIANQQMSHNSLHFELIAGFRYATNSVTGTPWGYTISIDKIMNCERGLGGTFLSSDIRVGAITSCACGVRNINQGAGSLFVGTIKDCGIGVCTGSATESAYIGGIYGCGIGMDLDHNWRGTVGKIEASVTVGIRIDNGGGRIHIIESVDSMEWDNYNVTSEKTIFYGGHIEDVTNNSSGSNSEVLLYGTTFNTFSGPQSNFLPKPSISDVIANGANATVSISLDEYNTIRNVSVGFGGTVTYNPDGDLPIGYTMRVVKTGLGSAIINAPAGEIIANSTVAGSISNTTTETFASLTITKVSTTAWIVMGSAGTWVTA